ncbi:MAG: M28 family peptidase [Bacteroidetes bacterium]|jgi:hypothetical protein|nr:M28 family peptidase [Bacteroidota bacterium]MBT3750951.1 M28 family peptidase [Bacteroidota bacterium]MBT4400311.1 M28 family peptidase [Bacteroidota bacterium]MBT4410815.1 M28 family peptidase [Bacteroidota bacterium]MBT5426643.1 M28 family peptidase [Bacteroidota bacterium]
MKTLIFLVLLALPVFGVSQSVQLEEYSGNITLEELKEIVLTLASDEFEGRDTGTKGQKLAAEYLRKQFIEIGLEGPSESGDPYYQEFSLSRSGFQTLSLIRGVDSLFSDKELVLVGQCPPMDLETELIFVGYGIDDPIYSDYPVDLSLEGKLVAFMSGEPKEKNGKYLISGTYLPQYTDRGLTKAKIALKKGAIGAIMINPDQEQVKKLASMNKRFRSGMQLRLPQQETEGKSISGVIHIGIDDAAILFNTSTSSILKTVEKMDKGKTQTGKYVSSVKASLISSGANVETENVVGLIKGSELPDEYVILTAHYDHLGKREKSIYNGADDNATGTAALVEVAETFMQMARSGIRPKRSVLFMPVSGEEKGLLGSRYYVQNPIFPLNKTVAAINMDMIGRTDPDHSENPDYVYVFMNDTLNSSLDSIAQLAGSYVDSNFAPEYIYNSSGTSRYRGSDHASFQNVNIPILYFFCGIHEDYHKPSDTWEKVEYDKLTTISKMVFISTWELANQ